MRLRAPRPDVQGGVAEPSRKNRNRNQNHAVPRLEPLEGRTLASADLSAASGVVGPSAEVVAPVGARKIPNIAYLDDGGRVEHLDLYLPTGTPPAGGWPAILALPGGGWRWVRRSDLGEAVSHLADYGYVVAVADYAYAGNRPGNGTRVWPTDFSDVQDAVRWLRVNAGVYGINPGKIAAWGESAGGHLAALLGTYPDRPVAAGVSSDNAVSARVQAVIDYYGPTDLTALYHDDPHDLSYLLTFLGGTPDQVPNLYQDASPIDHVAPGDPPFLIFQGTTDRAVPFDQSVRFAQALQHAGVPVTLNLYPGVPHGFRFLQGPYSVLPEILGFLHQALG